MSKRFKRGLSLLMALCMMLAMVPVTAPVVASAADGEGTTYYFNPQAIHENNERYAAYIWNDAGSTWIDMTDSEGDGIFEFVLPAGYTNLIFCRMNGGTTENDWGNKWDQTGDLVPQTDEKTCYVVSGKSEGVIYGDWSTYTPPVMKDVYVDVSAAGWSNVNVYFWGAGSATWPGKAMEHVSGSIWKAQVNAEITGIVFNDNSSQTADLAPFENGGDLFTLIGTGDDGKWTGTWGTYGHTITFVDEDGTTVLQTGTVKPGVVPTAPADPTKAQDGCTVYTFAGWDKEIVAVTGDATYTATYTSTVSHSYADGTCTVCGEADPDYVAPSTGNKWTKVELSEITSSDVIAITMTKDGTTWALFNGNGTDSAPTAVEVNVNGSTMTSTTVDDLSWNISNSDGTLTIYVAGSIETWLYSTSTNNGVRVGTNTDNTWEVDAASGYLKHQGTGRYLGVYTTKPDWRAYTNTTGNTAGQTLSFWKLNTSSGGGHEHNYEAVVTDPTCTEDGYTTYTCSACGDSYTADEVAATGHNYVDGSCTECGETAPSYVTATLVTDISTLHTGDQIIIVANEYAYALSTTQNGNNRGQADITKSEDGATVSFTADAGVQIITLEAGNTAGTFAFNVGDGYLYAASSSGNYLRTEETLSDNSSWIITIAEGVATVKAQGGNSRNWMRYNQTSGLFSCYASGQKDIAIYVINDGSEPDTCQHSYSAVVTAPTCTAQGFTTYTCDLCGESYISDYVATSSHTEVTVPGYAATCTTAGLTDGTKCSVCGETVTAGESIPALGHTDSNGDGACDTCGEGMSSGTDDSGKYYIAAKRSSGNYFYMTSDLGTASTKRYTAVDSGLTELPASITDPQDSYVFVLVKQADDTYLVYADGVTEGYLGWTSGNSGTLEAEDNARALSLGENEDGSVTLSLVSGTETRNLSLNNTSGNNYFAFYTGTQVNELYLIPVVEGEEPCQHTNTAVTGAVDATCTTDGYTGDTVCSDCGETTGTGETIAATGHGEDVTYTNDGETHSATYDCCGATYVTGEAHEYVEGICVCGAEELVETGLKGDVDLNGEVDMDDAVALMRHVLQADIITDITALANGEVTNDDTLDMDDAVKLMQYVLKAIDSLD